MVGSCERKKKLEAKDRYQEVGKRGKKEGKEPMIERGETRASDREGENLIRCGI